MHPADYMDDHESAYTDPSNPFRTHTVLAMACDEPLLISESKKVWDVLQKLVLKGIVKVVEDRLVPDLKEALKMLDGYSLHGVSESGSTSSLTIRL